MNQSEQTGSEKATDSAASADDGVPVGDSPRRPRWLLLLAIAAWGAWFVFLVVMMIYRVRTAAR